MRHLHKENVQEFISAIHQAVELYGQDLTTFDEGEISVARIAGYRALLDMRRNLVSIEVGSRQQMSQKDRDKEEIFLKSMWTWKHGMQIEDFMTIVETSVQDGLQQGWLLENFVTNVENAVQNSPKENIFDKTRAELHQLPENEREYLTTYLNEIRSEAFMPDWLRADNKSKTDHYDEDIVKYSEIIRLDPNNAYAYASRGEAYYLKGDNDRAIADCSEAIRLSPKGYFYYLSYGIRGQAYHSKGDYDQAISDYNEVIRFKSKHPHDFSFGFFLDYPITYYNFTFR